MNYWIISPNVKNDPSQEPIWKELIRKHEVAIMGWGESDGIGKRFIDEIHVGDIILIAQGANWQKKLFLAGTVSSDAFENLLPGAPEPVWMRKLEGCLSSEELYDLQFDFNDAAYGSANRIPALYKLKPTTNSQDLVIAEKLNVAINSKKYRSYMNEILQLLRYKKQIILQGPPGTGKTKMAKELASELIGYKKGASLSDVEISRMLQGIFTLKTVAGQVDYHVVNVDPKSRTVTLKKSTETEATTSFDKIRQFYKGDFWKQPTASNDDRRAAAIAKFIAENENTSNSLEASDQFQLIQFHPSYSYEDFVRGVTTKPNEAGNGVLYEAENKLLGEFAEKAYRNYRESRGLGTSVSDEVWLDRTFDEFVTYMNEQLIEHDHRLALTDKLGITEIKDKAFHIRSEQWSDNIKFSELKKLYKYNIETRSQLKDHSDIAGTVYHRTPYYFPVLQMLKDFINSNMPAPEAPSPVPEKSYVLIIDEINRANLSAVLGELIYALEYRGVKVDSMYSVNGSNEIVLPHNLYIIGTMNTADRSVGHIDYAIRRRFAFVDVIPEDLSEQSGITFAKGLYIRVAALFNHDTHLSEEFDPQSVQLGHSYFIDKSKEGGNMKVRLKYEIIPILEEYIKDGVLKDSKSLRTAINELQNTIS